jgi:hypothetical protein|tara:strand:+ start:189 stop:419 length:231 start_codon:yes stop_codon:yes gene_type:complete
MTTTETKSEKTLRLTNTRLPKTLKSIRLLGNLGNSQYELSEEQIDMIMRYLWEEVKDVQKALTNTKDKKKSFIPIK